MPRRWPAPNVDFGRSARGGFALLVDSRLALSLRVRCCMSPPPPRSASASVVMRLRRLRLALVGTIETRPESAMFAP